MNECLPNYPTNNWTGMALGIRSNVRAFIHLKEARKLEAWQAQSLRKQDLWLAWLLHSETETLTLKYLIMKLDEEDSFIPSTQELLTQLFPENVKSARPKIQYNLRTSIALPTVNNKGIKYRARLARKILRRTSCLTDHWRRRPSIASELFKSSSKASHTPRGQWFGVDIC